MAGKKITRSRNGCITCKQRRRKCDEAKPFCQNCIKSGRVCGGYNVRLVFDVDDSRNSGTSFTVNSKGERKYGFRGRPRIKDSLEVRRRHSKAEEGSSKPRTEPKAVLKPKQHASSSESVSSESGTLHSKSSHQHHHLHHQDAVYPHQIESALFDSLEYLLKKDGGKKDGEDTEESDD